MKFICYTDWDQVTESANALFQQAEKESIFFSRPWFETLTAIALENDHTMVLPCVMAGDEVMAMLPLMECAGTKTWYSLRHGFTPLYSLLIKDITDEDQEQVLACLVQGLSQLPVNALLLEPVASDDSKLDSLQRHLQAAGFSSEHIFRDYNWIYRLQGQVYKEYIADRPAQLRNTIARKRRKLEREHGFEIRLFAGDEVAQGMSDYYVVYNASWKQNEIDNADFLDGFIKRFSQIDSSGSSWTRLAILYVQGRPVAAQIWFVCHGKASIFRLAYDKAWRKYSTGSILTSYLMEHVIDTDRVEEIDFLTGNDAYKQDWMSERRERFLLSCIKSVKPTGRYERFVASLKRILKGP